MLVRSLPIDKKYAAATGRATRPRPCWAMSQPARASARQRPEVRWQQLCSGRASTLAAVHAPLLDLGGIGVRSLAREAERTLAFDGHCEIPGWLPLYPEHCATSEQEDAGVGQGPHRYRQLHCRALWNRRGAGQEYSSDAYVFRLSAYLLVVQPD